MSLTVSFDSTEPERMARPGASRGALGRSQLARLFRIVMILQAERFPNARELAERCDVSRRTIYRDLELLAEAGIPVRFRSERQGYQLTQGVFLKPTALEESEALALLVMARQWRGGDGLGLLRQAWSGAIKLVEALPEELRGRVLAMAAPFQAVAPVATVDDPRRPIHDAILAALARGRHVRVWFRRPEDGVEECTRLAIYRVLLHDRDAFLIGRSSLHRRVVVIGLARVRRAVVTDDPASTPPRFHLERFLAGAWIVGGESEPRPRRVALRFSARIAPEVETIAWHHTQSKVVHPDGRVELHFVLDGLDEILRWVLGFGAEVEVLEPDELRALVFRAGIGLARRHRPKFRRGADYPAVGG